MKYLILRFSLNSIRNKFKTLISLGLKTKPLDQSTTNVKPVGARPFEEFLLKLSLINKNLKHNYK